MLNHIVIMGRLTRDPEIRTTEGGVSVASYTVAVDRDFADKKSGEKQTDFFDCVSWRQQAEFIGKFFRKGSMIVVEGRMQFRDWTDKDNAKRKSAEIAASNVYFGESGKKNQPEQQAEPAPNVDGGELDPKLPF